MTQPFGPFSVSAEQVERLGQSFTPFVNRLLDIESAVALLAGADLRTTYRENLGDGGVDAGVSNAVGTRWVPAGTSAWQFKAGDPGNAGVADEFGGAHRARSIVDSGGKYILVIGKALNDQRVDARRSALADRAAELGLTVEDETFQVLDANALARWAQEYPSLAASPLLRGMSEAVLDFNFWARSNRHNSKWISSDSRMLVRDQVNHLITESEFPDLRIAGVSGLGKTRAVLEALRDQPYESLVVYIYQADALPASVIPTLLTQGREAIVVIDDCSAKQHETLAGLILSDSQLKLITIGEPDAYVTRSPSIDLAALDDNALEEVLVTNEPNLWREARRVVVDASAGNVRLALLMAAALVRHPELSASELLTRDTIKQFITTQLPDGSLFLGCSVLALFTSIGFEAELAAEIELVADALNIPLLDLQTALQVLADSGLASSHGRYRSVDPHPLAVYLARQAWGVLGDQIVTELIPRASNGLAERLLIRAAQIGDYAPTKNAVNRILAPDGPFSSLEVMSQKGRALLLPQMAVVSPDQMSAHLSTLLRVATTDQLRAAAPIRRSLVWALEKLVWHRRTFAEAADALLRLAQVETEAFSNNATGSWTELFGLMLPGTAAVPAQRAEYLQSVAESRERELRLLAVSAAARGLSVHEWIVVSGELQGGVVVEPRGTPTTWDEVHDYQTAMIQILRKLVDDTSPEVAETAFVALIKALHPLLEVEQLRPSLIASFSTLGAGTLSRVWTEVYRLDGLSKRTGDDQFASALRDFANGLPPATDLDRLKAVVHTRLWDVGDQGELRQKILDAIGPDSHDAEATLLGLLNETIPAAYDVGGALAEVSNDIPSTLAQLVIHWNTGNDLALVGFLRGLIKRGNATAFDEFLDDPLGRELPPEMRLALTVRGPSSSDAKARLWSLSEMVPVSRAASQVFSWKGELSDSELAQLLESWLDRLDDQQDYDAVVELLSLNLYSRDMPSAELNPLVGTVIKRRTEFPDMGRRDWDWSELAKRQLEIDPPVVLQTLLKLVSDETAYIPPGEQDLEVLRLAIDKTQPVGWVEVMEQIEAGSWQLQMDGAGWLAESAPVDVVQSWVGDSLPRARTVASVTPVRRTEPTDVIRFLLGSFGSDDQVRSTLFSNLISGTWIGHESARISGLIEQLKDWARLEPRESPVRNWALDGITSLERQLQSTQRREAERDAR